MPLHPDVEAFIKQITAAGGKPFHQMEVAPCRAGYKTFQVSLPQSQQKLARVEDRLVPGTAASVRSRIYTPHGSGPFPVMVYFHGGGWVVGDIETHDKICREISGRVGTITVSVDYRLAPEHKFPAAVDDAFELTMWAHKNAHALNGDPARLAVGGDSAGGNLAAVVARRVRDANQAKLAAQLLAYPATRLDGHVTQSMIDNATGYRLERADMEWFRSHYLNAESDGQNPDASPLLAADLSNLPPALILTCEFDPLRDEGEDYAHALKAAGVPVTLKRYEGTIHGALNFFTFMEPARRMMDESVQWLKDKLNA
jgi:acetyl esterase